MVSIDELVPAATRERLMNLARAQELARTRPDKPAQYRDESDAAYLNRCWRWEMWLRQEPRPDQSYASTDELVNYRAWRAVVTPTTGTGSADDPLWIVQ